MLLPLCDRSLMSLHMILSMLCGGLRWYFRIFVSLELHRLVVILAGGKATQTCDGFVLTFPIARARFSFQTRHTDERLGIHDPFDRLSFLVLHWPFAKNGLESP